MKNKLEAVIKLITHILECAETFSDDQLIKKHEGHIWIRQTVEEISNVFPNWNIKTVRKLIDDCVGWEFIMRDKLNKNKHDRTYWYAIVDKNKYFKDEQNEILD